MSKMRVISGIAKGRKLELVPGDTTRPITDRVKEALFNILGGEIVDCNFFDLFGGTGAVGIEALSRGAKLVRFVELNKKAYAVLSGNLRTIGLAEKAEVIFGDSFSVLKMKPDYAFDYLYIAPPQYKKMWIEAMEIVDIQSNWLVDDGWIVVQIDPIEYVELKLKNFSEFDQRKYGNTLLVFYDRKRE
jgi:16S rRNA (guanine966-N2)-methyltransferase